MVEELLRSKHLLAPFKTFQVISDPAAAQQISAPESKCLLDPASLKLVNDSGQDFGNLESRLKLFCLALKSKTDISHLESLHAWIRKCLVLRTQGWGMDMATLSSLWTLGRNRSIIPMSLNAAAGDAEAEQQDACEERPRKRRKVNPHKANSWNLFTHKLCSGGRGSHRDWSNASRAYRALTETESAALVTETKEAKA